MDSDAAYRYLKDNDPEWLAETLLHRVRIVQPHNYANKPAPKADRSDAAHASQGDDSALTLGAFDITATLPPSSGRQLTEHAQFLRDHDWASTPLGSMANWSSDLRTWVNFLLADVRAAALWWGPQRIAIYNEPYRHVAAHRHPDALGNTVSQFWPELVDSPYGLSFDYADRTGLPSSGERAAFYVARGGFLEEVWASWNVIPIPGPNGNLGYYNTVNEQTQEVVDERRTAMLQSLDQSTSTAESVRQFWPQILKGLEESHDEVQFAALYGPSIGLSRPYPLPREGSNASTGDDDGDDAVSHSDTALSYTMAIEWTLEGILGYDASESNPLPTTVDQDTGSQLLTPVFASALVSKHATVLSPTEQHFCLREAAKSRRFVGEQCPIVALLPIRSTLEAQRSGFLLLGLNPRRHYDQQYRRFVSTLQLQLTNTFATHIHAEIEARRMRAESRLAAKDRMQLVEQLASSQQEIQSSKLRFRSMADLAPCGIFTFSTQGTLLYANQYWYEVTGQSSGALGRGMPLSDALLEADRGAFSAQWQDLLGGKEIHFECRLKRPYVTSEMFAGERLEGETWILIAAYAISHEDSDHGFQEIFGCLVDISRQKWMEGFHGRRLKEQQERTRQQHNFMDSTSHEARNPLAAITLCADDLHTTLQSLTSLSSSDQLSVDRSSVAAMLENVEVIVECARHQKRIIDDVLTMSKLDSGMLTTSPTPEQPAQIVAQSLRMFQAELKRSDVELDYTVADSYENCGIEWVMLDGTRFMQILINLLTNAIKFTKQEQSRKITVTLQASYSRPTSQDYGVNFVPLPVRRTSTSDLLTPSEEIAAPTESIYLFVAIADTGPGINEAELENLFQRFQQASPKTYAQYGGSGLGLWISKELCAKLGGQIGVASSIGQGSNGSTFGFYVHAPKCQAPAPDHQQPRSRRPQNVRQVSVPDVRSAPAAEKSQDQPATPLETPEEDTEMTPAPNSPFKTILIVEDNLINQRVMRQQLQRAGFEVKVANHGKEALSILYPDNSETSNIDVILMDIEMPVMDGLECTKEIRRREENSTTQENSTNIIRIPILGVTANVRAEQQAAALESGMDLVVKKPFHMEELLAAMENVGKKEDLKD